MPDALESTSMSDSSLATRRARLDAMVIDLVGVDVLVKIERVLTGYLRYALCDQKVGWQWMAKIGLGKLGRGT